MSLIWLLKVNTSYPFQRVFPSITFFCYALSHTLEHIGIQAKQGPAGTQKSIFQLCLEHSCALRQSKPILLKHGFIHLKINTVPEVIFLFP